MLEFRGKGGSVDFFRLGGNRTEAIDAPFVQYAGDTSHFLSRNSRMT